MGHEAKWEYSRAVYERYGTANRKVKQVTLKPRDLYTQLAFLRFRLPFHVANTTLGGLGFWLRLVGQNHVRDAISLTAAIISVGQSSQLGVVNTEPLLLRLVPK